MFGTPDTTTTTTTMAEPTPEAKKNKEQSASIIIDYIQLPDLRTSYLSGTIATPTPEGLVNVMGYVERRTYPSKLIVSVVPGEENARLKEEGTYAWVREIQSSFLLDETAVLDTIEVLNQALVELRKRNSVEDES